MSQVIEIPRGKRTKRYRFFEILPGFLSYLMVILLIVFSIVSPFLAAIYLLAVIVIMLVKATGITIRTVQGNKILRRALAVDWRERLDDLKTPAASYKKYKNIDSKEYNFAEHLDNLARVAQAEKGRFPEVEDLRHAVILTMYNEGLDVMEPTMQSILQSDFDLKKIILFIAYEERGGAQTEANAKILYKKYKDYFGDIVLSKHPANIEGEVIGKGGNITYAGRKLKLYVEKRKIDPSNVIVTCLDSDNRPHSSYFSQVAYEYLVREERKHLSYQPVALFTNNIWDVPAMMRVIAVSNSFWNLICSMRPHVLRNFASHSQPLDALIEMDFWSVRTIVEDGHQYWRSLFYFEGNYEVIPIRAPIYQDAVLSNTLLDTLKAQFIQLRRWDYGASDVAYVGDYMLSDKRQVRLVSLVPKFVRLLDSHVTLAATAPIVTFGGWVPLLFNHYTRDMVSFHLPVIVGWVQFVGSLGLMVMIWLSFRILPKRPEHYSWRRSVLMLVQWILMPVVSIVYSSFAAFYSQTRLMLGLYMETFDVTKKSVKKNDQPQG